MIEAADVVEECGSITGSKERRRTIACQSFKVPEEPSEPSTSESVSVRGTLLYSLIVQLQVKSK